MAGRRRRHKYDSYSWHKGYAAGRKFADKHKQSSEQSSNKCRWCIICTLLALLRRRS